MAGKNQTFEGFRCNFLHELNQLSSRHDQKFNYLPKGVWKLRFYECFAPRNFQFLHHVLPKTMSEEPVGIPWCGPQSFITDAWLCIKLKFGLTENTGFRKTNFETLERFYSVFCFSITRFLRHFLENSFTNQDTGDHTS